MERRAKRPDPPKLAHATVRAAVAKPPGCPGACLYRRRQVVRRTHDVAGAGRGAAARGARPRLPRLPAASGGQAVGRARQASFRRAGSDAVPAGNPRCARGPGAARAVDRPARRPRHRCGCSRMPITPSTCPPAPDARMPTSEPRCSICIRGLDNFARCFAIRAANTVVRPIAWQQKGNQMTCFKGPSLAERQSAAAKARKAALEISRPARPRRSGSCRPADRTGWRAPWNGPRPSKRGRSRRRKRKHAKPKRPSKPPRPPPRPAACAAGRAGRARVQALEAERKAARDVRYAARKKRKR